MGITVRWDDVVDRVILMTYRGAWTWDEYDAAAAEIQTMIDATADRVDRIVDTLSNVLALPPSFGKIATEAANRLDNRLTLTVVVGNDINREILHALAVSNVTFQERYKFSSTIAEARKLIAEARGTGSSPDGHSRNGTSH